MCSLQSAVWWLRQRPRKRCHPPSAAALCAPPPPLRAKPKPEAPPVYTVEPEPEVQENDLATEDPVDDLGHAPHMRFAAKEADLILAEQDEVALRALVARVVREELQGDLGQRITSNLRKLVRREIRMILAAEKLDG